VTEPKPQWEGLYAVGASSTNAPDYVAKFTGTINGEPLSTEQLHELIVSQAMTIDAALTRNGELVDALKRIIEMDELYFSYDASFHEAVDVAKKALGIV
jgi:wyosine [tRNA(Phe)-imidazoG37] synthetase (radical SAM superfamily)